MKKKNKGLGASWMQPVRAREVTQTISNSTKFHWSPFHRDYAQIVYSDFFRRLAGKTQVHSIPSNDHIRTRLTHSVEVSLIGRQISRYFCARMNDYGLFDDNRTYHNDFSSKLEEVTAAACLLHDTGHPPFGHTGAVHLHGLAKKFSEEFDDNKQVFRMALNYVWNEKFDPSAPLVAATMKKFEISKTVYKTEEQSLKAVLEALELENLRHPASLFMEAADDIAYIAADLSDFLKYFSDSDDLQRLKEHPDIKALNKVSELDSNYNAIRNKNLYGLLLKVEENRQKRSEESISKFSADLIKSLVKNVFDNIDFFFSKYKINSLNEVPERLKEFVTEYSCEGDYNLLYLNCTDDGETFYKLKKQSYKEFILDQPYIGSQNLLAKRTLSELFKAFEELIHSDYKKSDVFKVIPYDFKGYLMEAHDKKKKSLTTPSRAVIDFVASMTDGYAIGMWEAISRPVAARRVA